MRTVSSMAVLAAALVLAVGGVVFSHPIAHADRSDDIEATFNKLVETWNSGDAATFATYFTDEGLQDQFETDRASAVEVIQGQMQDTGKIVKSAITDINAPSGNATAIVDIQFDGGFSLYEKWHFFYLDFRWQIGKSEPASRPIPDGVTPVALDLQEYSFNFDKSAVASGNVAFQIKNVGTQHHEVLLLSLDTDAPISDVVNSLLTSENEEFPPGVDFVDFGGEFAPGEGSNLVFQGPLPAGRYAFVCFLPSPEGVPHAALGMYQDFNVGTASGGGAISPPNTGDAGLAGTASGSASWGVVALVMLLALAGTGALLKRR